MPTEPVLSAWSAVHPIAEWHNHIRELAFHFLVLGISRPADVLWLIAVPTRYVPLDPLPLLALPLLVGFIFGIDLMELL